MVVNSNEHGIIVRIVNVVVHGFLPGTGHPFFEFFIICRIILTVVSLVDEDTANADGILALRCEYKYSDTFDCLRKTSKL